MTNFLDPQLTDQRYCAHQWDATGLSDPFPPGSKAWGLGSGSAASNREYNVKFPLTVGLHSNEGSINGAWTSGTICLISEVVMEGPWQGLGGVRMIWKRRACHCHDLLHETKGKLDELDNKV
ncbi:hypothetical protein N7513_002548 [Penicillium frequentans]|nr:hypothetical protein N7513_002548 [Penicillium glabrum]